MRPVSSRITRGSADLIVAGLKDDYECTVPGGAFYLFPKVPRGTGAEFVAEAIERNLLLIPGCVFSRRDTHARISYAATDETLARGIEVLRGWRGVGHTWACAYLPRKASAASHSNAS